LLLPVIELLNRLCSGCFFALIVPLIGTKLFLDAIVAREYKYLIRIIKSVLTLVLIFQGLFYKIVVFCKLLLYKK